jgi:hypothetical protein
MREDKRIYNIEPQGGETSMETRPSVLQQILLITIARAHYNMEFKNDPYNFQTYLLSLKDISYIGLKDGE